MVLLLTASGAATAAALGGAAGALWSAGGLPVPGRVATVAITATALVLDVAATRWPQLRAPAVGRQVPEAWGRLFAPETTALLYGARLGIGPATILVTWLWWAALLLGAATGPAGGALVGVVFHAGRVATMEVVLARGRSRAPRMAAVAGADRPVAMAAGVLAAVAALVLPVPTPPSGAAVAGGAPPSPVAGPPPTTSTIERVAVAEQPGDAELAALLLDRALTGLETDDAALGAGPLDLEAAAHLEPDAVAERALLETRGFRRGHSRAFTGAEGAVAYLQVYELADEQQAALYLADGRETATARSATAFPVDPIPGAVGFTAVDETDAGAFVGHAVTFAAGRFHVLVVVGSPTGALDPADAVALALRQHEHLVARGVAVPIPPPAGPAADAP